MSASGLGNLVFINDIRNYSLYLNILRSYLKLSAQNLGIGNNFIFYHDKDPKHKSLNVCLWSLSNCSQVLKTPPQLPDLNPIEQIWRELEVRAQEHGIKMKSQLKTIMMEEWMNIDTEITKKKN